MIRRNLVVAVAFVLAATAAQASFYDDYDAGLKAARGGQWSTVVSKMTAAIKARPGENNRERTYGAIFINYHPYYYRGVAYLNLGKYEEAVSDFEKTSGPGELDLGPLGDLMRKAKSNLESGSTPEVVPVPVPQPQRPVPVPLPPPVPSGPVIDPALRQRVASEIGAANASLANARNRKATSSPQYQQAVSAFADANTKLNTAKSNDDLNAALASAQNASLYADSATAPGVPAPPPTAIATVPPPKAIAAQTAVLTDVSGELRNALTNYFNGEFDAAERGFDRLTKKLPNNAWIWAFLGASRYSLYAFEGEENYKNAAMTAFRNAKAYGKWKNGLPDRYFSKRIRKVFSTLG
jgi:tetratricopeptide (TPR) repeat protein